MRICLKERFVIYKVLQYERDNKHFYIGRKKIKESFVQPLELVGLAESKMIQAIIIPQL